MKEIYQMKKDELYSHMGTGIDGLSKEQAAKILEEKGPNSLQEGKKQHFRCFLSNFVTSL